MYFWNFSQNSLGMLGIIVSFLILQLQACFKHDIQLRLTVFGARLILSRLFPRSIYEKKFLINLSQALFIITATARESAFNGV